MEIHMMKSPDYIVLLIIFGGLPLQVFLSAFIANLEIKKRKMSNNAY